MPPLPERVLPFFFSIATVLPCLAQESPLELTATEFEELLAKQQNDSELVPPAVSGSRVRVANGGLRGLLVLPADGGETEPTRLAVESTGPGFTCPTGAPDDPRRLRVALSTSADRYRVEGVAAAPWSGRDEDGLRQCLAAHRQKSDTAPVVIEPAPDVPLGDVAVVAAVCREVGIASVVYSARRRAEEAERIRRFETWLARESRTGGEILVLADRRAPWTTIEALLATLGLEPRIGLSLFVTVEGGASSKVPLVVSASDAGRSQEGPAGEAPGSDGDAGEPNAADNSIPALVETYVSKELIAERGGIESIVRSIERPVATFLAGNYFRNGAAAWGEAPDGESCRDELIHAMHEGFLAERHINACLEQGAKAYRRARGITMAEARQVVVEKANSNMSRHAAALEAKLRAQGGDRAIWELFAGCVVYKASQVDAKNRGLLASKSRAAPRRAEQVAAVGEFLQYRYTDHFDDPSLLAEFLVGLRFDYPAAK